MIKNDYLKIISFTGFGFASGLPYVLILITLTAWLRDCLLYTSDAADED